MSGGGGRRSIISRGGALVLRYATVYAFIPVVNIVNEKLAIYFIQQENC